MTLEAYHRLSPLPRPGGVLYVKPGARGWKDPLYELLARTVEPYGRRALDLNPGVGWGSLPLEGRMEVERLETSRAALRCLLASGLRARAALPWEAEEGQYDLGLLVLPANRGSLYVRASFLALARALRIGGRAYLAGEKDRGFERYFKEAREVLGYGEVVRREGPYRVALLEKEKEAPPLPPLWQEFEAQILGDTYTFRHLPGVFSAGRVDPASHLLLKLLAEVLGPQGVRGRRVLDLGAGYGALTLPLARMGGEVVALEDDLAAYLSLRESLARAGLEALALHSDADEALTEGEKFDIVVTNPPFHVGGAVILDVGKAFVALAAARLRPGGRFFLVTNPFLRYEPLLEEAFGAYEVLHGGEVGSGPAGRYKVLMAIRG